MLGLHNLNKSKANAKKRKRLGRGNASGMGNYSTRGMKGQKARSGGKSGLAGRSIKGYLLRIPKTRGFKSLNSEMLTVNLGQLEKTFNTGETINARAMLKAGLINTIDNGVKILSDGKLTKKLTIEANAFSAKAKEAIEKAGAKAVLVSNKKEKASDKKEVKETEETTKKTSDK